MKKLTMAMAAAMMDAANAKPSELKMSFNEAYQLQVEEYVDWRKKNRFGRVNTFTSKAKLAVRAERKRALLNRQAVREKSGFYEGTMALAGVLGQRYGRMRRQRSDNGGLVRLA